MSEVSSSGTRSFDVVGVVVEQIWAWPSWSISLTYRPQSEQSSVRLPQDTMCSFRLLRGSSSWQNSQIWGLSVHSSFCKQGETETTKEYVWKHSEREQPQTWNFHGVRLNIHLMIQQMPSLHLFIAHLTFYLWDIMKNKTTDMVSQRGILQWWVISMSSGKRLAGKFIPNNLLWHTRPRACKKQQSVNQCWVVWSWPLCAVRFYAAPVDLEALFHRSQGIYTETSYSVVRAAHSLPSPPLYCCMKTLERLFTETGEWKRCYDTTMLWHLKEQFTQKF